MNDIEIIEIEQVLHGYFDGHHLLAASTKLSNKSEKVMSALSDLSGPEVKKGFLEYITGYPLVSDKYYVISKTWYALEMKRPGCVWTHSLLIKFEDLSKSHNFINLLDVFIKPSIGFDKSLYSKSIKIPLSDSKVANSTKQSFRNLNFLIWVMFNHDQPIILTSDTSLDYTREIFFVWSNYSDYFYDRFSFCTGSLANRKIEDQPFDLQIVPSSLSKSISRTAKNSIVLDAPPAITSFPAWVGDISNQLVSQNNREFKVFIKMFDFKYSNKNYFKKFAELYTKTNLINNSAKISDFFTFANQIFGENDCNIIENTTVIKLFNKENIHWFGNQGFIDIILELCTQTSVSCMQLDILRLDNAIEKLWSEDKNETKKIFVELINNNINRFGENLVKVFAEFITPELLPEFTNLNISSCSVLISINYELAQNIDLWHQTRDFQLEIMNCLKYKEIPYDKALGVINTVLNNSKVDLCDQLYKVFKDISISIVLDWCVKADYKNKDKERVRLWLNICKSNPLECITWLSAKKMTYDIEFVFLAIAVLDPYSKIVFKFGDNPWQSILQENNLNILDNTTRVELAEFILPIILLTDIRFSNDIVNFVYNVVYDRLAHQQFDYIKWEKLEPLLPQLSIFNNWDKCKRLKKAIKAKGYQVL